MSRTTLTQAWRRFSFFDRERVKDPECPENAFAGFQDLCILQCISGRNGTLIVGETDGGIHQILNNKDWESNYFRAYANCLYDLRFLASKNVLITAGEDNIGINPFLKIWSFDKIDQNGVPFCIRCVKLGPGNKAIKVTCLAINTSGNLLVVGFDDSSIAIYRGDISKDKQSKPQIARDGLTEEGAVIALSFITPFITENSVGLFVGTSHVIATYAVYMKEREVKQGIYFYQFDSKGGMQLFEGEKVLVKTVANYLLVVYRDTNAGEFEQKEKMNLLTIYDMANVYIAYSAPIPQVVDVFYGFGSFYVVTNSGQLFQLIERDNRSKLDILFRKNLYDLAVKLAESCNFNDESLSDIYMQYGDFLYTKNDYQNSVKQYIKTIGSIEPSTVIKKFLDSQHITQLTLYLEALHKTQHASQDHTTILLNCYTKMSDSAKIDKFVKAKDSEESSDSSCNDYFNAEAGIKVLKESGYVDQALVLAKKHNLLDLRLKMLIEDKKDFVKAIKCMKSANLSQTMENLKKYGKILAVEAPAETFELATELCVESRDRNDAVNPEDLIGIFAQNSIFLLKFLEFAIPVKKADSARLYHTLLEFYLKSAAGSNDSEVSIKAANFLENNFKKFELDRALILCRTYNFDCGLLFLYEKANLSHEILRHFIDRGNFEAVVQACQTYGQHKSNKEMWVEALWFFARISNPPEVSLKKLLTSMEKWNILPPLMVLEILSHSSTISLGFIKEYLLGWLKNEDETIQKFQRQSIYYQQEIDKNLSIVEDIARNPQVFQVSKCTACDAPLEAPTVHFLCKHSYHQQKLRACVSQQEQSRDVYQQFKMDLSQSLDTIATVADYIGKGVFHPKSSNPEKCNVFSNSLITKSTSQKSQEIKQSSPLNPFCDVSPTNSSTTPPNPFDEGD